MDKNFLAQFDEERLKRVHKQIEDAKEEAKEPKKKVLLSSDEWEWYPVECPVCGNDGVLEGETDADTEYDGSAEAYTILTFIGERFECEQCGLTLEDYDELNIAGIASIHDRSEDVGKWEAEYDTNVYYEDYYN